MKNPRDIVRIIGLPMVCLAMFSIAGGHWAILQTIAWGQMLRDYSQGSSLVEAVGKTFDGAHPCALCGKVKQGRQREEQAPSTVKIDREAKFFVANAGDRLPRPAAKSFSYRGSSDLEASARSDAPPSPVPRDVLA